MIIFKEYRITSDYGYRDHPIEATNSFHGGIDLVKGYKKPIHAFTSGEVIFAGLGKIGTGLGGYGNVALIKDENNRAQLYAHLDSVHVKKGLSLAKNALIGYQGETGKVTGSHLHYEVRKKVETSPPYGFRKDKESSTINPVSYLEEQFSSLLKKGSRGKAVKSIQQKLTSIGFSLPKYGADGVYGRETEEAVRNFQQAKGLTIDGIVGPETSHVLEKSIKQVSTYPGLIKEGSKGKVVEIIQKILNIKTDGIFGPITKEAVKQFQSNHQLSVDGIIGINTWNELF